MTQGQSTVPPGSASNSSEIREELSDDASRLKDKAADRARQEAESRKGEAARVAGSASSALGKAASELENDDDAPDWLGSAMRQAASSIDRFAGEIEGRDVGEITQQVSRFARTSPGTFLAASAAAGFAAARFLRAGAEHKSHQQSGSGTGDRSFGTSQGGYASASPATSTGGYSTTTGTASTGADGSAASARTSEGALP